MLLIEYSQETQFIAAITLLCVLFLLFLASLVLIRAIITKEKILYWLFACVVLLTTMWFVPAIAYVYWLFTKEPIRYEWHMIGYNAFYPFGILAWLVIYTSTLFSEKKKIILSLFMVSIIIFEIYMFYFLFFAPNAPVHAMLGEINELKKANARGLLLFGLFYLVIASGTGMHFAIHSIKHAESDEIRWKGRLLIISFLVISIQIMLESLTPPSMIIIILITRILLIFVGLFFYLGFILPNWLKKLLSVKEETEIREEEIINDADHVQHFLHILSKPRKVTEEEVIYFREQTTCLVCKSKLIGYSLIFICFECRALYCVKCARAISKLENTCWACNNAIDESKPVKIINGEDEGIDIEGKK